MSGATSIAVVLALVIVVAIVSAGVATFSTTSSISVSGPIIAPPEPPDDGSTAVVHDLRASQGTRVFGIWLHSQEHVAHIAMVVPPECVRQDASGRQELLTEGACADLPVHGELTGGGTTSTGAKLVFVGIDISEQCFDAIGVGDLWPSAIEACADDE